MVLGDCEAFLNQLFDCEPRRLNANVLICIFLRLTECFILKAPKDLTLVGISIFCVCVFFFCFYFKLSSAFLFFDFLSLKTAFLSYF